MRIALVVLLVTVLMSGLALAQSENSIAATNQAKAIFLKQAGLPENVYDVIGQKFTYFYDQEPAGWNSISGIVWGINFRPRKQIDVFVSVPRINGKELHYLSYKQRRGHWGWYTEGIGSVHTGELNILPPDPPKQSK